MKRFLLSTAALLVGLVGAAVPAAAATEKTATPKQAVAVAVTRTARGEGGQSVFSLVGSSNRQQAQVLRLASTREFLALRPKYSDSTPGRYTYVVEAGYRDSTKKRVTVVDGTAGTPKVVLEVIRLMTTMPEPNMPDIPANFPPGFPFD
ncbi:hypothetical protein [Actinoplanes siamensis]|nr:hypothetical protein [Actinoplanes siamensis]